MSSTRAEGSSELRKRHVGGGASSSTTSSANNSSSFSSPSSSYHGRNSKHDSITEIPVIGPTGRMTLVEERTPIPLSRKRLTLTSLGNGVNHNHHDPSSDPSQVATTRTSSSASPSLLTAMETPCLSHDSAVSVSSMLSSDTQPMMESSLLVSSSSTAEASPTDPTRTTTESTGGGGPRKAMTGEQVKKEESKLAKILTRVFFGLGMFGIFCGSVYMGHLYVCALVALIELLLFRELVRVRYSAFFHTIQDTIPLFRTTQWMWFAVAIFFSYGDFISDTIQNNRELHHLLSYVQYFPHVSFLLYSGTFVLTISTLQRDHIKFQINQLCWTILVLCLTVGQLKYVMHNIFNGLFWFVLPCCLVFANDIMAYVSGMTWGRKFIQRPFISFSPNKTWEGFIGGAFFTLVTGWYLSRFLAQFSWMACPTNEFRLLPDRLDCQLDPVFVQTQYIVPSQIFELLPRGLVKAFPRITEICYVKQDNVMMTMISSLQQSTSASDNNEPSSPLVLTPCVSGEEKHMHHHFELVIKNLYPIQAHALWLSLFASLVAPFGGFLASAIKRAYGIKDFDSIIPGHGGVMDRMDCQFLMALCTWVHYNTFIKLASVSVAKLTYMYSLLTDQEKAEFLASVNLTPDGIKSFQSPRT